MAEVTVVIASHGRALRLRWLLNALEEQDLGPERWQVIVVHDYDPATAERVIACHPLSAAGRLRAEAIAPGTGSPARQRNLGWRMAAGERVAFVDDDCRPVPGWLTALLAAANRSGTIVQGRTQADPEEAALLRAPHVRTMWIDPVGPYAQTCNILYPRLLLETLGGFDERAITGEDVDLSLRAKAAGARITAAPDAVVYHAVESFSLVGIVRQNLKWRHLARLVHSHPEFRAEMPVGIFWDDEHLRTSAALLGLAAARRTHMTSLALTVPYVAQALNRRGPGRRRRALALAELPGQAVRQSAEVLGLLAGSVRHRTIVL
jgi:glycosyltransferase involved in cell wall biosynthesis